MFVSETISCFSQVFGIVDINMAITAFTCKNEQFCYFQHAVTRCLIMHALEFDKELLHLSDLEMTTYHRIMPGKTFPVVRCLQACYLSREHSLSYTCYYIIAIVV